MRDSELEQNTYTICSFMKRKELNMADQFQSARLPVACAVAACMTVFCTVSFDKSYM